MDKKLYRLLVNGELWSIYHTKEELDDAIKDLKRRYPKLYKTAKIKYETYVFYK